MNTFHKILFVLAILIANCISASAIEFTVDGVRYSVNNDNTTVTVAGYPSSGSKPTGELTIPPSVSYGGKSYSVTSIGNYAFQNCTGLTSVTIPNSVTSIGDVAFYDCSGLTSVTIGNSVTNIGSSAFSGTAWYNNQPDGLVYAGLVAYKYKGTMPSGTDISLKPGTKGIAGGAFYKCSGLTSITIPNSVTNIGGSAFSGCTGLTSVTIPNSVTTIGSWAFSKCTGLTNVIWNAKTCKNNIYYSPFYECTNIKSFEFGSEVEKIPDYLCYCLTGLTSVTIPNSVTTIDYEAFAYCSGLRNVTIGAGVKEIGFGTFEYCEVLSDIKSYPNPAEVKMGSDVFENVPQNVCKLHVLPQYLTAYKSTAQWMNFPHIEPMNDVVNPDVSGDGVVGVDDLNIVINHILGSEDGFNADINGDNDYDVVDLNMIINAILNK